MTARKVSVLPTWEPCKHEFEARADIMPRYVDKTKLCVDLRVRCHKCKRHWRFEGLPGGVFGGGQPATPGHMGYSALLPIAPMSDVECRIIDEADPFPPNPSIPRESEPKE